MYPEGHVQMALPLTGLVSQLEPSLQGLLMQASSRWHSKPGQPKEHVKDDGHTLPNKTAARSQGTCRAGDKAGQGLTCAAVGTLAVEGGHPVVAGGPMEAGGHGTVIDVLAAVLACPAIDTDTVVAAVVVVAGATVLAGVGHQLALIHILSAVLTWQGTGQLQSWH